MDISIYFKPVYLEGVIQTNQSSVSRLDESTIIFTEDSGFPDLDGIHIAIIGVNEDRLVIRSLASNMGAAFARIINDFTRGLADLGPSPLIGACPEDETIC